MNNKGNHSTNTQSSGADVSISREGKEGMDPYKQWLGTFVANNINTTQAFYSHPKILVTALNGPAVGLSAALIGFSDFIYAAPHAFILTPFTSLGLVAEGGASRGFVQRMGIAKANEALIMSKRITSDELVKCGFVNEVFDTKPNEQEKFLELVLKEVDNRLGEHLVSDSMTKIKALIRKPENDIMDAQGVRFPKSYGDSIRFMGIFTDSIDRWPRPLAAWRGSWPASLRPSSRRSPAVPRSTSCRD
jgi:peroxisomal 3,2-trans-enoyl-CoA isomerase